MVAENGRVTVGISKYRLCENESNYVVVDKSLKTIISLVFILGPKDTSMLHIFLT